MHVLSQGGHILPERGDDGRIKGVTCVTREGFILGDCTLALFARLKRKRLIDSRNGGPYRISRLGRTSVRSQLDNR